ncbi:Na+/H+ antiporter [Mycobacterium sp.]|uniref:Na+/H+ antiporter n=1 Tax=Mycobacterium sp. TaxID=1785 RepID=UPI001272A7D9|nr:Na+/H+ antiporter [Mycobacterium sp.]KAA8963994.1 MAG: Na+/H+ antiporter [Mycobacterium sp.]
MTAHLAVLLFYVPLATAAAGWLAERFGVPYPVLLVGAGALLTLSGWAAAPELPPVVMFYVFLPPLVYFAAYFIAPGDLRANAGSIGLLAVGLVLVTMAAVAAVMVGIAGIPLTVAAVAGAVVAPTDTVAAASVFRRLNAPERLVTIVEGEGLINDGTALVLYVGAVAAAVAGVVRPRELAKTVFVAPLGGAVLGLVIAWILVSLRRRLDQPLPEITLSLATPYLTYVLAQSAGLSGVLATVVAGTYVGSRSGLIFAPGTRLQAFAFLDVLVFLLNGALFTFVGMQLVRVVHRVPGLPTQTVLAVTAAVSAVVVGSRLAWLLLLRPARVLRHPKVPAPWRERAVIGWTGMRGGVSLAAALAIPLRLADGSPFPYRDLVLVVAAAVIVVTLVVQGMSLPWLLSKLDVAQEDSHEQARLARLEAANAALRWLDSQPEAQGTSDPAVASLRTLYESRLRRLQVTDQPAAADLSEAARYRTLRLEMLGVERAVVAGLRQQDRISATVLRTVERSLDLEEARLRDF